MLWNDQKKAFVVGIYLKTESFKESRLAFQRKFNINFKQDAPNETTIYRWVKAFKYSGSVKSHINVKGHSKKGLKLGRPICVRTPEK